MPWPLDFWFLSPNGGLQVISRAPWSPPFETCLDLCLSLTQPGTSEKFSATDGSQLATVSSLDCYYPARGTPPGVKTPTPAFKVHSFCLGTNFSLPVAPSSISTQQHTLKRWIYQQSLHFRPHSHHISPSQFKSLIPCERYPNFSVLLFVYHCSPAFPNLPFHRLGNPCCSCWWPESKPQE